MIRRVSTVLLGLFYLLGGINHFRDPGFYLPMMPDYLPAHLLLVQLSGVAEIALGVAIWIGPLRRWAAWGIIALLIAVFPANLHVAIHDIPLGDNAEGLGILNWVRLPLQAVLIAWAFWHTRPVPGGPAER